MQPYVRDGNGSDGPLQLQIRLVPVLSRHLRHPGTELRVHLRHQLTLKYV